MAERLPVFKQRGVQIDPYRAADFSPLMRETRNVQAAQQKVIDRVVDFATKIGAEQAETEGRASVTDVEQAKGVLQQAGGKKPVTIYDRAAYDQANELLALELENQGRKLIADKVSRYKNDPNADPINFLAETADVRDGLESLTGLLDPKLRGRIAAGLDRVKDTAFLEISETYNTRVAKETQARGIAGIAQRSDDIVRLAISGMANAEGVLFTELGALRTYAQTVETDPIAREKVVTQTLENYHIARLRKDYEKAPDKAAFLKAMSADLAKGPVGDLFDAEGKPIKTDRLTRGIDPGRLNALTNEFEADLRARAAEGRALRSELKGDISETLRIFSLGSIPDAGVVSDLQRRTRALGLPANDDVARQANYLGVLRDQSIAFSKMSSVQLGDWIRNAEQQTAKGATLEQAMLIDVARKSLTSLSSDLEKDPVSRMNRTGYAPVKTLNFGGSAEEVTSQIRERITQSKSFAAVHSIKPKFLSNDEASAVSNIFVSGSVPQQIGFLDVFVSAFGKEAGNAMSEVSKFSPELAHIGGLKISGANPVTLTDALNGMKLLQAGNKVFEGTGDAATKRNQIADQLGGAYAFAPNTRAAILKVADAIYTQRSITSGATVFDSDMYQAAFQEAAGAIKGKDGKLYGGIIEYRGIRTPIPNNIPQNDFSRIINRATYDDFVAAAGGNPEDDKGRQFTIDRLRKGYPAFIDDNRAVLYFEDYRGKSSPLAFTYKDKSPLVVDFRILADRVKSRDTR